MQVFGLSASDGANLQDPIGTSGELDGDCWESYQKMLREIRHIPRKADKAIASQDKKIWKQRSKDAKVRDDWRR